MRILEDDLNVDIYLELRKKVGWVDLTLDQAQKAIDQSIKTFTVHDGDRVIGMARLVGDGAVVCYIQDLVISPDYQGKHIGSMLIDVLVKYVESITLPGTRMMFCLMCAKGREAFYEKHGFTERPTDALGPGMIQFITK